LHYVLTQHRDHDIPGSNLGSSHRLVIPKTALLSWSRRAVAHAEDSSVISCVLHASQSRRQSGVRYEVQDFEDGETVIESDSEAVCASKFRRCNFVCAIKIDGARRKPEHSRHIRDLLDYVLDLLRLNRDEVNVIIGKRNFMLTQR